MHLKYYLLCSLLVCFMNMSCKSDGYIITSTNNMIKGTFNKRHIGLGYDTRQDRGTVFTAYNGKEIKIGKSIKHNIKEIDSIASFNVINKRKKDTITYILSGNYFWQLLATEGNLGVYIRPYSVRDGSSYHGRRIGLEPDYLNYEDIAIYSGKTQKILIYRGIARTATKIEKQILKFINERYNLNLTENEFLNYIDLKKDIEHQKKLYDFILDQEIKLE